MSAHSIAASPTPRRVRLRRTEPHDYFVPRAIRRRNRHAHARTSLAHRSGHAVCDRVCRACRHLAYALAAMGKASHRRSQYAPDHSLARHVRISRFRCRGSASAPHASPSLRSPPTRFFPSCATPMRESAASIRHSSKLRAPSASPMRNDCSKLNCLLPHRSSLRDCAPQPSPASASPPSRPRSEPAASASSSSAALPQSIIASFSPEQSPQRCLRSLPTQHWVCSNAGSRFPVK